MTDFENELNDKQFEAVKSTDFNTDNLYVVSSFKEAMDLYLTMCDKNSVVLLENDLPDNYLN